MPRIYPAPFPARRHAIPTLHAFANRFIDSKLHHIVDSHVAHHIFSDMPFYGAKKATPYIKEHLGAYYKSSMDSKVILSQTSPLAAARLTSYLPRLAGAMHPFAASSLVMQAHSCTSTALTQSCRAPVMSES